MAVLTRDELAAAVAALEWIGKRADLATVLNKMPAMQAEKKPPKVTAKGLKKAINFLKAAADRAAQTRRIANGMKIKEWLKTGELDGTDWDTKELLTTIGDLIDSASVDAVVGPNLFRGSDGTYYTVVVEASVEEASDEFVQDVLQELCEDGDDEEPEVLGTVINGEKNGQQPHPPPNPDLAAAAAELTAEVAAQLGKPLADVLDTSDTPPLKIADILDRVESEAVAGAYRLTRDRAAEILDTATKASVRTASRPATAAEVRAAWAEFGGWHLPTLREHAAKIAADVAAGEDAPGALERASVVIALRDKGFADVADLGILDAEVPADAGNQ